MSEQRDDLLLALSGDDEAALRVRQRQMARKQTRRQQADESLIMEAVSQWTGSAQHAVPAQQLDVGERPTAIGQQNVDALLQWALRGNGVWVDDDANLGLLAGCPKPHAPEPHVSADADARALNDQLHERVFREDGLLRALQQKEVEVRELRSKTDDLRARAVEAEAALAAALQSTFAEAKQTAGAVKATSATQS